MNKKIWFVLCLSLLICSTVFATEDFYDNDVTAPWGNVFITGAKEIYGELYADSNSLEIQIYASDDKCKENEIKYHLSTTEVTGDTEITDWSDYTEGGVTVNLDIDSNVTNNIYVVFKDKNGNISYASNVTKQTINYDSNGGSEISVAETTRYLGTSYTVTSQCPVREGYFFLGWSTDSGADTASYKAGDTIPADASLGSESTVTLYAIWSDELPQLADVVSIGDYVDYPVYYNNVASNGDDDVATLNGWRVLSIDEDLDGNISKGTVNLVSAGVPLTYYNSSNASLSVMDLTDNFLYTNFATTGFSSYSSLANTFSNIYTASNENKMPKVRAMTKEEFDEVYNMNGVTNKSKNTMVAIPTANSSEEYVNYLLPSISGKTMYVGNNGVTTSAIGEYGVRPVVSLKSNVLAKNIDTSGVWEIELSEVIEEVRDGVYVDPDTKMDVYILSEEEIENINYINNPNISEVVQGELEDTQVPIPTGFSYLLGTGDTGLVIADEEGNEFVWIPANASEMYVESGEEVSMSHYDPDFSVKTNRWGKSSLSDATYGAPNTTNYREPAIVVGDSGGEYDATYYANAGDFSSLEEFAEDLKTEFNNMIDSTEMYGGFYVGRYELGLDNDTVVCKQGKLVLTVTTSSGSNYAGTTETSMWYGLYKLSKRFTQGGVQSSMIWRSQWDVMVNFIGDHRSIQNTLYLTGQNPSGDDEFRHVHDTSSNVHDFCAMASSTESRRICGGSVNPIEHYASSQGGAQQSSVSNWGGDDLGSRPQLYIKLPGTSSNYTITLKADNGIDEDITSEVSMGTMYTLPENTFEAPEGQKFAGWSVNGGSAQVVGSTIRITKDTTITALWESAQNITITFDANNETGETITNSVPSGSEYTLPANAFTHSSLKKFIGWDVNGTTYNAGDIITPEANVTIKALWEEMQITVEGVRENYTYTGSGIYPIPNVYENGLELTRGQDFTLSYGENTYLGTGTITITFLGNYGGSMIKEFTITEVAGVNHAEITFVGYDSKETVINNETYIMPNVTGTVENQIGSITVGNETIYYPIIAMVMSDGETAHTVTYYGYYPVFDNFISITDYVKGDATLGITYDTSTTVLPKNLTPISDMLGETTPEKIFNYSLTTDASKEPIIHNDKLYYSSAVASAAHDPYNTVVKWRYVDYSGKAYYYYVGYYAAAQTYNSCITPDTLLTLADGTRKRIDEITYEDQILAWDFEKGEYAVTTPAVLYDHGENENRVIKLTFDDGTVLKLIGTHDLFSKEKNEYVAINEFNVRSYLGHEFVKMDDEENINGYTVAKLVDYSITEEYIGSYSILTSKHLNCITEGMFSRSPSPNEEYEDFFDFFEIGEDMKYDKEAMQKDIEKYGLYTYEDYKDYVTYEQFVALNGAYFKVLVGKGYITFEDVIKAIYSYVPN